ncbi:MAG: hypothetical protein RMJ55_20270, partial [Roseiflexaceae bacterium]|nr:hypothetical protein [Roseiflexaceae bacterium]
MASRILICAHGDDTLDAAMKTLLDRASGNVSGEVWTHTSEPAADRQDSRKDVLIMTPDQSLRDRARAHL